MDIYILDRKMNVIGVVGTYESILWNQKFYEPGYFKASFAFSKQMNAILQRGNLLYKEGEKEPGFITRRYLKLNKRGEQTIQVQGYMASRYLHKRIVWEKTVLRGTPEEAMRKLVYEQVIAPWDSARKIPGIELGDLMGYEGTITKQVTYDNLQETLTAIAKTSELGYRLRLDIVRKCLVFEIMKGTDRRVGSSHPCIFSRNFQNVFTQDYYEDDSNFKNVCLIGGTGEDENRALVTVGDASGMERYEVFYNAAGLLGTDIEKTEYLAQLRQKGLEKLNSYALVRTFENKIDFARAMPYELGDYVTCTDEEWGVTVSAQVTAIETGYSKNEESCVIMLGNQVPTLIDLIKAKE